MKVNEIREYLRGIPVSFNETKEEGYTIIVASFTDNMSLNFVIEENGETTLYVSYRYDEQKFLEAKDCYALSKKLEDNGCVYTEVFSDTPGVVEMMQVEDLDTNALNQGIELIKNNKLYLEIKEKLIDFYFYSLDEIFEMIYEDEESEDIKTSIDEFINENQIKNNKILNLFSELKTMLIPGVSKSEIGQKMVEIRTLMKEESEKGKV